MKSLNTLLATLLVLLILCDCLQAQTPAEVRRAFVNLRSDHIKHNCGRAMDWLYAHRDALKDQMVQELYLTDRQGRDALLHVLFNTESFVPDDRFRRFVMARLPEEDKFVSKLDIEIGHDSGGGGSVEAHWEAWNYIDSRFKDFEPLLEDAISHSDSMFVLWGTTWILARHRVLKQKLDVYTSQVMDRIASNLKNDNIPFNASQASRTFLLLGKYSVPTLQQSAHSSDHQMANFSRALIDAIKDGNHEAFGYLSAQVSITRAPTDVYTDVLEEPEWLGELTWKYVQALSKNPDLPYP
jgi:hypothetical protein